jgi:hypothetical protein
VSTTIGETRGKTAAQGEPHWPAALAVLAVGLLSWSLPESLTFGPGWLLLVLAGVLLIPIFATNRRGREHIHGVLGHTLTAMITAALLYSLTYLVVDLPTHRESPLVLLRTAGALWVGNILVFASWYWRLDAGGPHARARRGRHAEGAFLFPQMTLGHPNWRPGFVDYLFLAFNTSTAFSPTDCPVLTPWAKILMMLQSMISLGTVVLLAARAVNVL